MKLDNEFTVGVPIGQAWGVLTDLELIAPCMPGAQLTGVTDDGVYSGKVRIKVGPVTAEYSGTAKFTEKDIETYRAVIDARGRDSRGNGNAAAVISAQLRPEGDSTAVTVTTNLTIAGRIAQFGSGMIKEVSAKLLGQFVECLEGRLGGELPGPVGPPVALTAPPGTADPTAAGSAAAAQAASEPGTAGTPTAPFSAEARPTGTATAGPDQAGAARVPTASTTSAGAEPAPLDLMSVAGRAVYKRLAPVAVVLLIVVAVVIYLLVR
jgi:uncharacterized protein